MKSRIFSFVGMIMVHILCVNCRHLAPTAAIFTAIPPQQLTMALELGGNVIENRRMGSTAPNCEHKCFGCSPCEATQVPANGVRVNVSVQYSNYEPEGWKCKCGRKFYSP
ncbi:hypothetical protein R6Q59_021386 [Mikania micrantha]|uniref:Epidermal patterning factor-like protein n=1 Tax=Mikania micrantha TaxID=192012 RepID=A0A5N6PM53_9ASTR|nr:hypothetical protein E3N88_05608 [Mikania micrantha]